jgi:membrane-bound lytic murein transglycosylase MltF
VGWEARVFKERRRRQSISIVAKSETVKVQENNCAVGLEVKIKVPGSKSGRPEGFPRKDKLSYE